MSDLLLQLEGYKFGSVNARMLLMAAAMFAVCRVLAALIQGMAAGALRRFAKSDNLGSFFLSLLRFALWLVTLVLVARELGIPGSSLLAMVSVIGLAVSLAVQGSLSNLAGGVTLMATTPFRAGDFIEALGISGTVQQVHLIYTKMLTADNKAIFIPNSELTKTKIVNYSSSDTRRVDIVFFTPYSVEIAKACEAALEAAAALENVLREPETVVGVSAFSPGRVQYVLRAWVDNASYRNASFSLFASLQKTFAAKGLDLI